MPQSLVAAAQVMLGFGEQSAGERGRFVESILRESGQSLHAQWDLAFIHHVGWWSQRAPDGSYSSWPLPRDAMHRDLSVIARERRMIRVVPAPGDVVLYWSDARRCYARSGIIIQSAQESLDPTVTRRYVCTTIEGNLTERGEFGGMQVREMRRTLSPVAGDLFIRWSVVDARRAMADPGMDIDYEAGRLVMVTAGSDRVAP
jgi:hypothetical protein